MTENFTLETARQKLRQTTHERNSKMNTSSVFNNDIPAAESTPAPARTVERKIGKATFIVTSRFNDGNEKDIVSYIPGNHNYENQENMRIIL